MPSAFRRWKFVDPYDTNPATREYVFPWNPNTMSSPFAPRAITALTTTAVNGQALVWEGNRTPVQWTFGGTCRDSEQYEALRAWTLERNSRIWLYDHFGRRLVVNLMGFDPTPKRAVGRYWLHEYTITALVLEVGPPSVGDV